MMLIVGLGNPGAKYRKTRHNIGFMAIDALSEAYGISCSRHDFSAEWGKGKVHRSDVILAKPQTFMNLSGKAVQGLSSFFKAEPKDILVMYDDIDLGFGTMRIRLRGGSGGHKGMESIIQELGSESFARIRLGIGRPKSASQTDIADYVLSNFTSGEKETLEQILDKTKEAVDVLLHDGIHEAMNRFNKK